MIKIRTEAKSPYAYKIRYIVSVDGKPLQELKMTLQGLIDWFVCRREHGIEVKPYIDYGNGKLEKMTI